MTRCFLLLTTVLSLIACDHVAVSDGTDIAPLAGRVVSISGEPVAGAVVVATVPYFGVAGSNLHEGVYYEQRGDLSVRTAITDAEGRFAMAGERVETPPQSVVSSNGVQIGVYATGFEFGWLDDSGGRVEEKLATIPGSITSSHNGSTIHLKPTQHATLSAHDAERLRAFVSGQGFGSTLACRWRKMPTLIAALEEVGDTALAGKLKDGCDAAPAVSELDKPAGPPLAWQNEAQQWQLLIDLDRLDTEGQRTPPAPFNGVFVIHFSGAAPSAEDSVMLENIKDGSSFVYGQEAPMIASDFDVFHVRVLRLSELMQQPPEMGVSPQGGSAEPDK